jgi:hypothetical protein
MVYSEFEFEPFKNHIRSNKLQTSYGYLRTRDRNTKSEMFTIRWLDGHPESEAIRF